jgi:hypothetical protein
MPALSLPNVASFSLWTRAFADVTEERVRADVLAVLEAAGGVALHRELPSALGDEGHLDLLEGHALHDLPDHHRAVVVVDLVHDVEQRDVRQLLRRVAEVLVPGAVDELEVTVRPDALDDVVRRLDHVAVAALALVDLFLGLPLRRDVTGDGVEALVVGLGQGRPDEPAGGAVPGDQPVLELRDRAAVAPSGEGGLRAGGIVGMDEIQERAPDQPVALVAQELGPPVGEELEPAVEAHDARQVDGQFEQTAGHVLRPPCLRVAALRCHRPSQSSTERERSGRRASVAWVLVVARVDGVGLCHTSAGERGKGPR